MKGSIEYSLWTILGTVAIKVIYDIVREDETTTRAKIEIQGHGSKPKELENEETMSEIVQACIEDMQDKIKDQVEEPEDYKRVLPDSLWGAN